MDSSTSKVTSNQEAHSKQECEDQDGATLLNIGHKLNGYNDHQWSYIVMMFICSRGKDNYLTNAVSQPTKEDPNFNGWKTKNNMVMSW